MTVVVKIKLMIKSLFTRPPLEKRVSFSRSYTTMNYLSAGLNFYLLLFAEADSGDSSQILDKSRLVLSFSRFSTEPIFGRAISVTRACEFYCLYVCSTWPTCLRTPTYTKQATMRKLYKLVHIRIRLVSHRSCISCLFLLR